MKFVGFLATPDTAAAIDKLMAAASRPGALANKSDVLRRVIEEAAARLDAARAASDETELGPGPARKSKK